MLGPGPGFNTPDACCTWAADQFGRTGSYVEANPGDPSGSTYACMIPGWFGGGIQGTLI